jgi:hypothetical protein
VDSLTNDILPNFKENVNLLFLSNSWFDSFLSKSSYSFWLTAWSSKILTNLNNPFSFWTISYGNLANALQKTTEQAIAINSNWAIKKNNMVKKMKSSGGVQSKNSIPDSLRNIDLWPTNIPQNILNGYTPDQIYEVAKSKCIAFKNAVNPDFPDNVNWTINEVRPWYPKDKNIVVDLFVKYWNTLDYHERDICVVQTNRCHLSRTKINWEWIANNWSINLTKCTKKVTNWWIRWNFCWITGICTAPTYTYIWDKWVLQSVK